MRGAPMRGARAVASVDAVPSAACDALEESARLQRAQGALRDGRWAAAIADCADDERVCATGPLSEERERVRIEALARSGRDAEARARWSAFQRRYPDSSYRDRLRALWPDEAP